MRVIPPYTNAIQSTHTTISFFHWPIQQGISKIILLSLYRVVTQITQEHDFHQIKGTVFCGLSQAASAYTPLRLVDWRNRRMHQ